ncbi:hypothetical protein AGLY_018007, partial [Aphis glycines]
MDIERIRKDLENKIDKVNKIKADNKKETKRGGSMNNKISIEEADRVIQLKDKLKKIYKNAALKNIYYEEEKEKSYGPVTNELKNIVTAVNEVKDINIKTDEDIQKILIPYQRPELLRLSSTDEKFTPVKSTLASRSPLTIKSPLKPVKPATPTIKLGENTTKYLPRIKDPHFGIYYNNGNYMIGKDIINFKDDNIIFLNGKTYKGTPGLFRLLCYYVCPPPEYYTQEDFNNYKEILITTDSIYQNNDKGPGRVKSSKGDKYNNMIADIWKELRAAKQTENDLQENKSNLKSDFQKEGSGLKKYSEDQIEYKYIHNLSELLKRLYFIASEEKAGNNNFDNEKLGVVHFFSTELEKLAVTPQGIDYLISYVTSLPEKVVEGSGLMNNLLNSKFMPEIHWPGYNYLGPFTDLEKKKKPVNELDKAAMEHDYYYKEHKDIKTRHIGDKILEDKAWNRFIDPNASLGEKTAALVTTNAMKNKLKKAKNNKKGVRLVITNKQLKNKVGGFLPLIIAGIGALSALAGGASAVANTFIDANDKKKKREEAERHNKEMENNIKNIKTLQIGCFMKDKLPLKPWKNECGILNLNNSEQSGSHWVAWVKNDKKKIYFDSYGDCNPPKEVVKYLGKDNLFYTTDEFQNYNDPPMCGHLCLDFIKENSFLNIKKSKYQLSGRVLQADGTNYPKGSNIILVDNFVAFLFTRIEVKKHGKIIDTIDNVGRCSLIKGTISYSADLSGPTINCGFQSKFTGGGYFSAVGKLSNLCLGFFKDIQYPVYKGGFEISFLRHSDDDALFREKNDKNELSSA